jgi:MGT family glycosyltransferase
MSGPEGAARDQAVARGLAGAASAFTGAVNAGRATVGLGPLSEADEILLRPPLVLYLTSEPFEYPRPQWPPTFRLIGPCAWDPPQPPPEWLANERRGLVIVTTSSEYQGDESLISTALQALRDRTSLCVIATVPSGDAHYDCIPNNARIERFVAHSHLLPRAVAVVCHAGMGITQKALTAGVPVCCVPFGRDQFEVARRVEVAGAGTLLPAAELTPDRLRVTFERALLCRSGAAGIAAAFARTGGARAGADALEQIARRRAIGIRPD